MPPKNWKNDGRRFENVLKNVLSVYTLKGLLHMEKVEPPSRISRGRVIFLMNPFIDYIGTWTENNGRMVACEAKSTSVPKLCLNVVTGGLTRQQFFAMQMWHRAGAAVFLLWEHAGRVEFFNCETISKILTVRKHLVPGDGIEVPKGNGFVIYDFIQPMRTVLK
jgi:penicillin-binding protein-related factor A (putative recombinase)